MHNAYLKNKKNQIEDKKYIILLSLNKDNKK